MLYAALAMIVVGVLCFLYVSLSPNSANASSGAKRSVPERGQSQQGYSANYRHQPLHAVSPQLDERIRRDREIADVKPVWQEPNINYTKPVVPPPSIVEKTAILKDSEEGFEEVPAIPEPKIHSFHMEGILYLDHSGKIPFGQKDLSLDDASEEALRNFKRVGPAKLKEEDGKFVFYSGNASYTYQSYELDQVVFYDQGIAFLLKDTRAPRPIYFTKEMDELKEFLEQAAVEV
jgi:hypothetical protein